MRFIVDEDVPKSAADYLVDRHHDVTHVQDVLLRGSDDYLIARWGHENSAIVVTCNVAHFRRYLHRPNYANAGLLGLPQASARSRLEQFIDLLEMEDQQPRVWLEIRESTAWIVR